MSVRYDFYQTDQKVVIAVQIKNAAERNCVVDIGADRVTVKGDEDISLELALFDKINDAESTYRITPIKIEISLKKIIGDRWPTLTKADGAPAAPAIPMVPVPDSSATGDQTVQTAMASVKPKDHKDWDKVVKEICTKEDVDKVIIKWILLLLKSSADKDCMRWQIYIHIYIWKICIFLG